MTYGIHSIDVCASLHKVFNSSHAPTGCCFMQVHGKQLTLQKRLRVVIKNGTNQNKQRCGQPLTASR